jgi:PAS domain S-box-containing protein
MPLWDDGQLYRLLVRDLNEVAIFMVDLDGRIITWNAGVERTLGLTSQSLLVSVLQ